MSNCLNCSVTTENPKFCCSSCSVSFNNKNNHWRKQKGILKGLSNCLNCGKVVKKTDAKYCSRKCIKEHELNERIVNGDASSKTTKRFLLKEYGNKCSCCGIEEWNKKPIVMELEHKDGNSSNNSLDNVCLLCPNCHSQTDTYKNKNKGNGRHYRRLRYSEGKSY